MTSARVCGEATARHGAATQRASAPLSGDGAEYRHATRSHAANDIITSAL